MKGCVASWIFQPELEKLPRNKHVEVQEERLRKIVRFCHEKMTACRKEFKDAGITSDEIKTLDDLEEIPFTEKEVDGVTENYQIIVERPRGLGIITLCAEPDKELFESVGGDLSKPRSLISEIGKPVKSIVGVKTYVEFVPYGTLPRFVGKAIRVEDLRKHL